MVCNDKLSASSMPESFRTEILGPLMFSDHVIDDYVDEEPYDEECIPGTYNRSNKSNI